jgi:hypothetical protein
VRDSGDGHSLRARRASDQARDGFATQELLSVRCGYRLERALARRLANRHAAYVTMRVALRLVIAELLVAGRSAESIPAFLSLLVEQTAHAHFAGKRSILTGELDWTLVQAEVIAFARLELQLTTCP